VALGVAEHLFHRALPQGVGVLPDELAPVVQWTAALGLNQQVGEQEEHPGLRHVTLGRHPSQPALADVPPPWRWVGGGQRLTQHPTT